MLILLSENNMKLFYRLISEIYYSNDFCYSICSSTESINKINYMEIILSGFQEILMRNGNFLMLISFSSSLKVTYFKYLKIY